MIVKFKDEAPQAMRDFVIQTYAKNEKELRGRGKGRKLTIKDNLDLSNVLFEVKQMDSIIEFAEPNYIVTGTGSVSDVKNDKKARPTRNRRVSQSPSTPNDSQFGAQWALNNTGQGGGAFGSDIGAIPGWQKVKGDKDTVVAVIDTGVDTRHPDLARNLWSNKREANGKKNEDDDRDGYVDNVSGWNFVNDTPNVNDDHGHGTAMAGILAAETNNHQGIAGVMWQASLMPLKALDSTGSGAISDVVEAIDFAVNHGAGVINCSFGTEAFSQSLLDAISRAASSGVLIVASAGNNGWDLSQTPYYPASYAASNLIAVAATNNSDLLATFSNYGANNVHVAAPGIDVLTTYPNNRYVTLTGTSAAAPLVAGVAGLLKSRRGFVSAQWVRKVIVDSARKVPSLNGKVSSGGVVSAGESIALFIKNEEEGGLAGSPGGGGPGGGGSGGGGGTGGGPGGQMGAMNLDFIRNNRPNGPEPRVTVNNVPSTPYDDPEPGTGGLGGYFYQESLAKNSTGVAGGRVGENADPTGGDAAGQSSINLGSQNVNFAAPIVSLGGRGGLGVSLALYYNSNIYVKNGSSIAFNTDKDVAGVGWSIGFGSIEGIPSGSAINPFWDSASGKNAFLFIRPDGGRHVLAQVGSTNTYTSYDSTWLEFDNANKILRTMNGTRISFITPTYGGNAIGKRLLPSQIKDRNGNYITITNAEISNGNGVANNSHDWGIDYITDTMGRTIDFYYESNLLRKVRQDRGGGNYFTYALLSYAPVTISTNFSGLTTDPSTLNGTQVWVPWWIEYPTGHTHRIFYTSYGQMYSVEKWVPTVAGQGNGRPVAFTRYDMQSVSGLSYPSGALVGTGGNTAQTDCPKFSLRQEWAENWSPTGASSGWTALSSGGTTYYVAQYSYEFNSGSNYSKVIDPIDRVFRTDVSTDGLTHTSKTYASQAAYSGGSGTPLKTATITYEKDTGLSYTSNLRVQNVQITDGSYTRRTNYAYTTVGGATLPYDVKEYLGDATTVYRYTRTNYNSSTTYSDKHIFGLPSEVLVYKGDNTLVAKTAFTYDESGYFDTTGYTVTNHDASNYGTGYVAGRANLTTVTQFEVPGSSSRAVSHAKFDMLGNTRAVYDGANHVTEYFYDDNFVTTGNPTTRALVTKVKDPDSYWSGAKYNYHTGQAAQNYHIAGTSGAGSQENIVTYTYNSVDRLIAVTQPSGHGGQVTRDYWDNWMAVAEYVTIDSGKTRYSFVAYDGAGQTRWNGSDHPDGTSGKYSIQTFGYDSVGRTKSASNPTAADGGLSANYPAWDEDYYFGWLYTTITYDALDRQTVVTRPDDQTVQYSYTGCGCAGTSQVTVTDERGKKRKTVYDFLGRLSEAYNLTSASATYAKAVYSYDERDLLQNIKHYNNGSAYQERTFGYDGYGRLTSQTTPEAGTASYEYWADDTVKKVTDARSLYAQFTYNNRGLVTVVDYSDSTLDVHYDYGEYGERTLMQEKSGSTVMASTSYGYDTYKRLQTETRSFNGLSGSFSVGYTYNYADALKQISYTVGAWNKSVNYDYNYAGAPTKIGTNLVTISGKDTTNNVATAFDFRAWGALQRADFGNDRRLALGYNQKRSQLSNLKLQKTDNSDVVTNISYDYYNGGGGSGGNNGRVRYITDHLDGNYSVDVGYDDHNRLTSYGSYRSYTYDAWNNLLSVSSSNGVGEAPNYTLTYATNGSGAPSTNRINNSGYSYDNAGNLTNDGGLSYAYDAAGRLKTAGTNNSCEYDGDGR
ncbi:MAG: S8 family serine peptidase, partial [Acidobacteriota bacterium]|nr:S8 family serine peptidase [Acidobacteriota bacterium]